MPLVEHHGGLWFWPGDPERADRALLPDFAFCTGPEHLRAHFAVQANYEYVTDNLMDLSHAEFLHKDSFGTKGTLMLHGKQTIRAEDEGAIWNNWDITRAAPPNGPCRCWPQALASTRHCTFAGTLRPQWPFSSR